MNLVIKLPLGATGGAEWAMGAPAWQGAPIPNATPLEPSAFFIAEMVDEMVAPFLYWARLSHYGLLSHC